VVISAEAVDLVLNKKLDGSKLPLTTTGQEIFVVHTDRYIKKLVSNEEYSAMCNKRLTGSAFRHNGIASKA
jgi:hypothetical protein